MLFSTSQYSYTMSYLPGKQNILADYGTRQIPETNWESPLKAPLELCPFTVISASIQFPQISKHSYTSSDFEELNKFKLQPTETDFGLSVLVNGEVRTFVPQELGRACFWAAHFPLHHGQAYSAQTLREHNLYWPLLDASLVEYLSQCVCAKKKPNKFKKIYILTNKHISASYPLQLVCIDIYSYEGVD